jgi:hypothetical protein
MGDVAPVEAGAEAAEDGDHRDMFPNSSPHYIPERPDMPNGLVLSICDLLQRT